MAYLASYVDPPFDSFAKAQREWTAAGVTPPPVDGPMPMSSVESHCVHLENIAE